VKIIYLILFEMIMLVSINTDAQVKKVVPQKITPKQTMSSTSDSIKMAVNDAKTSFNTLFKGHKDTTLIQISNIEYEDPNLTNLKECLKKLKGVKTVSMQYSASNVILKIPFRGKPTDLWDELPAPSKAPFKLIEASDNEIMLKFKNDNAAVH
jgi:hypothetical protein